MKTAAAFAAIVAVAVFVTTDEIQATPSLRGLRSTAENQSTQEDKSSKGRHARHMKKVVKKVTKIAIPVPVRVPQYIPVPKMCHLQWLLVRILLSSVHPIMQS